MWLGHSHEAPRPAGGAESLYYRKTCTLWVLSLTHLWESNQKMQYLVNLTWNILYINYLHQRVFASAVAVMKRNARNVLFLCSMYLVFPLAFNHGYYNFTRTESNLTATGVRDKCALQGSPVNRCLPRAGMRAENVKYAENLCKRFLRCPDIYRIHTYLLSIYLYLV